MESIPIELLLAYIAIAIAVFAVIAGFGVAVGMDARTKGEHLFAVTCFIISALMIVAVICLWDVTTQSGFTARGLISVFSVALVCFALAEVIRWTGNRHEHAKGRGVSGPPTPHPPSPPAIPFDKTPHRPSVRSAPSQQPPQTIIQVAPAFGNLKERTIALSAEIMNDLYRHGWPKREGGQIPPGFVIQQMPMTSPEIEKWAENRSNYFKLRFLDKALDIRNEFSQLHLRDERLDDFFKYQGTSEDMNRKMAADFGVKQHDTPILPQQIEEVANRLQKLADQIKG